MSKISMNEVSKQCKSICSTCEQTIQIAKLELDSIQRFVDDRILQGKAYNNIKGYFGSRIVPLLLSYIDVNRSMIDVVGNMESSFLSAMDSGDVLDLNIIQLLLDQISDLYDRLYYYNSKGHRRKRSNIWNAILELKRLLEKIKRVSAIDRQVYNYFDTIDLKLDRLSNLLNQPGYRWGSDTVICSYDEYFKNGIVSISGGHDLGFEQEMRTFMSTVKSPASSVYRTEFSNKGVITDSVRGTRDYHYGYYGSYQGAPLITYTQGSDEQRKTINDVVHSYYPTLTNSDVVGLITALKYSGCTYASATNAIFEQYKDQPQEFESTFKMPMFVSDKQGNRVYNYDGVMLDYFLSTANAENSALKPNQDYTNSVPKIEGMRTEDSVIKYYQKKGTGGNSYIEKYKLYLDSKNITYENRSNEIKFDSTSLEDYLKESDHSVVLGITPKKDTDGNIIPIPMYQEDGRIFQVDGGHAVNITGINQNGDFEIATWGEKYLIHADDVKDTGTLISFPNIEK